MKLNRFYILFSVLYLLYLIFWWNALPNPLFEVSYSTLLLDRKEEIMGVKVAQDEQFRFPGTNVCRINTKRLYSRLKTSVFGSIREWIGLPWQGQCIGI